jgi:hypothetical protein
MQSPTALERALHDAEEPHESRDVEGRHVDRIRPSRKRTSGHPGDRRSRRWIGERAARRRARAAFHRVQPQPPRSGPQRPHRAVCPRTGDRGHRGAGSRTPAEPRTSTASRRVVLSSYRPRQRVSRSTGSRCTKMATCRPTVSHRSGNRAWWSRAGATTCSSAPRTRLLRAPQAERQRLEGQGHVADPKALAPVLARLLKS